MTEAVPKRRFDRASATGAVPKRRFDLVSATEASLKRRWNGTSIVAGAPPRHRYGCSISRRVQTALPAGTRAGFSAKWPQGICIFAPAASKFYRVHPLSLSKPGAVDICKLRIQFRRLRTWGIPAGGKFDPKNRRWDEPQTTRTTRKERIKTTMNGSKTPHLAVLPSAFCFRVFCVFRGFNCGIWFDSD